MISCGSLFFCSSLLDNFSNLRDFGDYFFETQEATFGQNYWKQKYRNFYTRRWQFEATSSSEQVSLSNEHFTVTGCSIDYDYCAVKVNCGVSSGSHYFEIQIESQDKELNEKFDKAQEVYLSVTLANKAFEDSIDFHNDGSIFVQGDLSKNVHRMRVGDRIGVWVSFEDNLLKFYINGELEDEIEQALIEEEYFFNLLFMGDMNIKATITSGKYGLPKFDLSNIQQARLMLHKGKTLYHKHKYEQALPYLEDSTGKYPLLANAWKFRGRCLEELNRHEESVNSYTEYVKNKPDISSSYNERGNAYSNTHNYELALKDYDMALKLAPDDLIIMANKASTLREMGDINGALNFYNQILTRDGNNVDALDSIGKIQYQHGKYTEALEFYNRAISIDPECVSAYYNRGCLYKKLQQYETAVNDLTKAAGIDNEWTSAAISVRASCFKHLNKFEDALRDYSTLIKKEPDAHKHYLRRAKIWELYKGDLERALKDYEKAILNPNDDVAWNNMSALYNCMGKFQEAIEVANKSIELKPEKANSYNHRGFAFALLGNLEQGLEDINKSVSLDPKYIKAFCHRAYVLYLMKRIQEAMQDCETVIKTTSSDIPDVYYVRGLLYGEMGEIALAIADLQHCEQIVNKARVFPLSQVHADLVKFQQKL